MNLTFKPVSENEWQIVSAIEKACETKTFLAYTEEGACRKYLQTSKVYLIVHENNNIGTISYEIKSINHAYVDAMTIIPEYRQKGCASIAMTWLMKHLSEYKTIDLYTHPYNNASIRLYLKFGFVIKSWHDNYFGDGEPRLHLVVEKN